MDPCDIRLLTPSDTKAFMHLRREALELEPFAFAASIEDDRGLDPAFVHQMLAHADRGEVIGAFKPGLVGMVGIYRDAHQKAAHKAYLWGMYVQPAFRQAGIGSAILSAAINHARSMPDIRQIHLSVSETAEAARRLYERHGFQLWGTEPKALLYQGRFIAEHHLALTLE